MDYRNCRLCPRQCGVDRENGQRGFCGCPGTALVAKAMLHKWEEPALAGRAGRQRGGVFWRLHSGLLLLPERRHQRPRCRTGYGQRPASPGL